MRTDDGRIVECKVKGNFRLRGIRSTNPVAVGDGVTIKEQRTEGKEETAAFITEIDERRNYIIRKASNLSKQSHILAANVDMALLVVTIARPETSTTFIDRFLASAEAYRVPVCIAFNKIDDLTDEERELMDYWFALYTNIGYKCYRISALNNEGIDALREELEGRTTLLAGHSGVGKSTLLNLLIPDAKVRTAQISDAHGTGMHTTTFSELFELPAMLEKKNVDMLMRHRVYSRAEIQARYEIILENYCKTVNIEALTMVDMARKEILPAVAAYEKDLADTLEAKLKMLPDLTGRYERRTIAKLSGLVDEIDAAAEELDSATIRLKTINDVAEASYYIRDVILHKMAELRIVCDEAEMLTAEKYWPFPTYEKLLFGVR